MREIFVLIGRGFLVESRRRQIKTLNRKHLQKDKGTNTTEVSKESWKSGCMNRPVITENYSQYLKQNFPI